MSVVILVFTILNLAGAIHGIYQREQLRKDRNALRKQLEKSEATRLALLEAHDTSQEQLDEFDARGKRIVP